MGDWLDLIYDVLFNPAAAMRSAAASPRLGFAGAAVFISLGVPGVILWLLSSGDGTLAAAILLAALAGGWLVWVAAAAVFYFTAGLLGGKGQAAGMLAALALAFLPLAAAAPVWTALAISRIPAKWLLGLLSGAAVGVWVLALLVVAVREAAGITTIRAVAAVLFPGAVLLAGLGSLVFLAGALIYCGW